MLEKEFVTFMRDVKRLDRKEDVLRWWKTRDGFTWPSLSELSDVVLATPASQVSVERLFSNLKFVLSTYRYKVTSEILEAILLIRSDLNYWQKSDRRQHFKSRLSDCSSSFIQNTVHFVS